eukprot:COSAG06_NODE_2158_length_7449_cov_14.166939_6_plen_213_part_00
MATATTQVRPPCARAAAVSPAVRLLTGGARCEQEPTDLERFRAEQPVAALITSLQDVDIPHGLGMGTRLKRTRPGNKRSKKFDYGIVVHINPVTMDITVLWMRDADALDLVVYERKDKDDFNKLASYKNAFLEANKKSAVPQAATFEILKNYWCAPFPPPPAVAGFAARAALRWVAGLLIGARPARLHAGGLPRDGDRRAPPLPSYGQRAAV